MTLYIALILDDSFLQGHIIIMSLPTNSRLYCRSYNLVKSIAWVDPNTKIKIDAKKTICELLCMIPKSIANCWRLMRLPEVSASTTIYGVDAATFMAFLSWNEPRKSFIKTISMKGVTNVNITQIRVKSLR